MLWEYKVAKQPPEDKKLEVALNAFAQDGWEPLPSHDGTAVIFRRCARCKGMGRIDAEHRCPSGCPE